MITTAFKKLSNGNLDLKNPIIVDSENLPDGYYLLESGVEYIIPVPEPQPPEPSLEERIQALEVMELERILGGGF